MPRNEQVGARWGSRSGRGLYFELLAQEIASLKASKSGRPYPKCAERSVAFLVFLLSRAAFNTCHGTMPRVQPLKPGSSRLGNRAVARAHELKLEFESFSADPAPSTHEFLLKSCEALCLLGTGQLQARLQLCLCARRGWIYTKASYKHAHMSHVH